MLFSFANLCATKRLDTQLALVEMTAALFCMKTRNTKAKIGRQEGMGRKNGKGKEVKIKQGETPRGITERNIVR